MTDNRFAHYSRVLHPVVIVLGPYLFLQAVVIIIVGGALSAVGLNPFPPFLGAILLFAGIIELILGNVLSHERISGIAPRLRELILVLAISMALILYNRGDRSGPIDLARLELWSALVVVAAQWLLSHTIHRRLSARTAAHALLARASDDSIQARYAEISHEAGDALESMERIRRLLVGFLAVGGFVSVLVLWAGALRLGQTELAWSIAFFVGTSALVVQLDRHADIDRSLASGHVIPPSVFRRLSAVMLVFLGACALVAIPISGDRAMLPESHLADAVAWLRTLGPPRRTAERVEQPELELRDRGGVAPFAVLGEVRALMAEAPERPDRSGLLMWAAVGLGGAGFLWFLFAPIVTDRASLRSLLRSFAHAASALWAGAASALGALRRLVETRPSKRSAMTVLGERPAEGWGSSGDRGADTPGISLGRRDQRGVLRSFHKFVRWAKRHGVEFRPSLGAGEFAARVADAVPQYADDVVRSAALFEEIVFSAHESKTISVGRYHDLVASLSRTR